MRLLHVIGSSNDNFMFDLSFLYGKNCPLSVLKDHKIASEQIEYVQYDYALYLPSTCSSGLSSRETTLWYFIRGDQINVKSIEESTKSVIADITPTALIKAASNSKYRDTFLSEKVKGPFSVGQFISLLEREQKIEKYGLMVPHFFDYIGVTTIRSMFEDVLKIPSPGPTPTCGVLSQNKALTRLVLANVPNVRIPKGEALYYCGRKGHGNDYRDLPTVSVPLPFVVKPAEEDNSRGVSLCRTEDEVKPALVRAFGYGKCAVIEEFIPGREIRAACVTSNLIPQIRNGEVRNDGCESVHVLSCKVEYVLGETQIRTEEDKLTYVNKTVTTDGTWTEQRELVQVKCERRFLTPNSKSHALSRHTIAQIDAAIKSAHVALGSRDYSMYDFRVHENTGDVYLVEPCSFWTFSPIAFLSLAIEHSDEFATGDGTEEKGAKWKSVARKMWLNASRRHELIN